MPSPWAARALAPSVREALRIESRSLAAQHLMASVMRDGGGLAEEYPLVFGPDTVGRIALIEGEDRLARSACALLARELRFGGRTERVGLIGSVATDPAHRGRGLASRVLAAAETELARQGCRLSLLWAEEPGFYHARGYRTIGRERDLWLPHGRRVALPSPVRVRRARSSDAARIHALYSRHETRVLRSLAEMRALLEVPEMEVLVYERGSELRAYSCRGRGADLAGVVHEWGGGPQEVMACLAKHQQLGPEVPLILLAAPDCVELADALRAIGFEEMDGVLGMARLLDRDWALELIAELAPEAAAGSRSLGDEELLELLFAAEGGRDLRTRVGCEGDALPLEPYVWGLDSV